MPPVSQVDETTNASETMKHKEAKEGRPHLYLLKSAVDWEN